MGEKQGCSSSDGYDCFSDYFYVSLNSSFGFQVLLEGVKVFLFRKELRAFFKEYMPLKQHSKTYLTRKETAALLKISLVTLNDWTNKGILTKHKIGGQDMIYSTLE